MVPVSSNMAWKSTVESMISPNASIYNRFSPWYFPIENLHVGCGFSHMFHWKKPPGTGWNPRFDPKRQDRESLGIIQNLANALVEEGHFFGGWDGRDRFW